MSNLLATIRSVFHASSFFLRQNHEYGAYGRPRISEKCAVEPTRMYFSRPLAKKHKNAIIRANRHLFALERFWPTLQRAGQSKIGEKTSGRQIR